VRVLDLSERVAERLGEIEGVEAVVLGGSSARGEARPDSDLDIGIYYRPERRPSVAALRQLAAELDDRRLPDLVTDFGEWGPCIDGGGWLRIEDQPVDWLYRDLGLVERKISGCRAGRTACHYQPGHPHGFHEHIYAGEIHHCKVLHDPSGTLAHLKSLTAEYPPLLKRAVVDKYLWEADFALHTSRKPAARGDAFYVGGCLFRCAACLVQVLFALNERYFVNEKGSVETAGSFTLRPDGFAETVSAVLAEPGHNPARLTASVAELERLLRDAQDIVSERLR
jgi:predicted nucleotidyltransferase